MGGRDGRGGLEYGSEALCDLCFSFMFCTVLKNHIWFLRLSHPSL